MKQFMYELLAAPVIHPEWVGYAGLAAIVVTMIIELHRHGLRSFRP